MAVCRNFQEFERNRNSIVDDVDAILFKSQYLPKDFYIYEDKYLSDMALRPELKKYIDLLFEKKIRKLKKELMFTTEESLIKLWDNEYDDQWNDY